MPDSFTVSLPSPPSPLGMLPQGLSTAGVPGGFDFFPLVYWEEGSYTSYGLTEARGQLVGGSSFLQPCGFWGPYSILQSWWQALIPPKLACWPQSVV